MPTNEKDYALVVGLQHYRLPDLTPLEGAVNDAEDFAAWLTDKQTGGGLPETHCKVALSAADSLSPIQDEIDDCLLEIFNAIGTAQARRFYLFFSGHGLARSNNKTDLCLTKWSYDRCNMALDVQNYLDLVMESGKFLEVVFFLDCCRVRDPGKAVGRGSSLGFAIPGDLAGRCRKFGAYATEFQSAAFEAESPDPLDHNRPGVRGHFTQALIAALRGGAAEMPGGVPTRNLMIYLDKNTRRFAKDAGHQQIPEFENGFSPSGEPIFGSALRLQDVEIAFSNQRQGPIVLVGPDLKEIKRGAVNSGPWRLTLRLCLHQLIDEATGVIQDLHCYPTEGVFHVQF